MYGNFFSNLSSIISKKCVVTPVFFFNFDSPCQNLLFPHNLKPRKNIVVLVGKFFKDTRMSQDTQNVCAVTKGGTVLYITHNARGHYGKIRPRVSTKKKFKKQRCAQSKCRYPFWKASFTTLPTSPFWISTSCKQTNKYCYKLNE